MLKLKNKILFAVCNLLFVYATAQTNLVPNPSFEIHDTCPSNQGQTSYAVGWSIYRLIAPYYNACAIPSYLYDPSSAGMPANGGGYQYALDGQAYIGVWSYFQQGSDSRAAAGCQLTTTLTIGTKYYVSFWASLSAIDSSYNYNTATDHLGALFSTVPYNVSNPSPKNNHAQVYGTTLITDTVNWTKITGSFVADSAYKYIALGNFFDNAHTNEHFFYTGNSVGDSTAFYYIDMVCVSTDSLECNTVMGIKDITGNQAMFYYNSSDKKIIIKENGPYTVQVIDTYGNQINELKLQGFQNIDVSTYNYGCYIVILTNQQGITTKKIIINP